MLQRVVLVGLLSACVVVANGCQPRVAESTSAGNQAAAAGADQSKDQPEPTNGEKAPKTKQVTFAITGMT
jgi:hypothetical protein